MSKVLIWGASGQAKVIHSILKSNSYEIIGFIDKNIAIKSFLDHPVYNSFEEFSEVIKGNPDNELIHFVIAIGGTKGKDRIEIGRMLMDKNYFPLTLQHQTAWVADSATIGKGCQILGMSAISEYVSIGDQTIVNTNATIDHETRIGKGSHVMPGATIAGCVQIGDYVTIGSNATILPRVKIGSKAIVGAGAVVTRDVMENDTVIGVPAKSIKIEEGYTT